MVKVDDQDAPISVMEEHVNMIFRWRMIWCVFIHSKEQGSTGHQKNLMITPLISKDKGFSRY